MERTRAKATADLEKRTEEIRAVCGVSIPFEVEWSTFGGDPQLLLDIDRVSGYAAKRAVQTICETEAGKDAIRAGLRGIKLINVATEARSTVALRAGVLEIHSAYAEGRIEATSYEAIRAVLDRGLQAVNTGAYSRFVSSMTIGLDQWRDGAGYDLEALSQMTAAERAAAEEALIRHLTEAGDWRDVEALAELGTPGAVAAIGRARQHQDRAVRNRALAYLLEHPSSAGKTVEKDVIRAVGEGAIELAPQCPTPAVKHALLECAASAEATVRVNAAAMLLFLCGQASEPFDWSQRPFFLRFGADDPQEVKAAWEELRQRAALPARSRPSPRRAKPEGARPR